MSGASRKVLVAVFAPALLLTLGCAVPLPAPALTATAESQPKPVAETRSGSGGVQAVSAGPLKLSSDDGPDEVDAEGDIDTATPGATPTPRATQTVQAAATPEPVSQPENYATDLLNSINQARVSAGVAALVVDASLMADAQAYSRYMGQANFFGHNGLDGSTPSGRAAAAGFRGLYWGETLTAGQGSPGTALSAFMNSSAHSAILLDGRAVYVGVGYFYAPGSTYKHYWAVVTGK
jgi:uncharacterized protein YkwD